MPVFDLNKLSFNAGIWSEKLDARSDLARYGAACSELLNFIPHPYGGISNRAGTEYVFSGEDENVRLISFQFNSEQSYIIAMTHKKAKILKDGGLVVDNGEVVVFETPYEEKDLQQVQYIQSADVLYMTHPKYKPKKITRSSHVDWKMEDVFDYATVVVPRPKYISVKNNKTTTKYNYAVTLVDKDGREGEYLKASEGAAIGAMLDFEKLPEEYENCVKYNVYREKGGVFGWVDSTMYSTWVDPNAGGTNPDMNATPPLSRIPCKEPGDYPTCACIHQGRLLFAGSDNKPRTLLGSRSGSFDDFSIRSPLQDDDSYEFEISGGQVDRIHWMRSFNGVLLVGCGGGEYLVTGESNTSPITPNSVNVKQQTSYGCARLPSLVAGATVLFIQEGKNIVRDMFYSLESDQYNGNDISVLAENLFVGKKITAVTWQRDPNYVLWAVRNDGILLGLTYIKEQQVWAWHRHETKGGKFVDVAVIRNNDGEDDLYLTVERGGKYFVELMKSRELDKDINKSWFLDSAVEFDAEANDKADEKAVARVPQEIRAEAITKTTDEDKAVAKEAAIQSAKSFAEANAKERAREEAKNAARLEARQAARQEAKDAARIAAKVQDAGRDDWVWDEEDTWIWKEEDTWSWEKELTWSWDEEESWSWNIESEAMWQTDWDTTFEADWQENLDNKNNERVEAKPVAEAAAKEKAREEAKDVAREAAKDIARAAAKEEAQGGDDWVWEIETEWTWSEEETWIWDAEDAWQWSTDLQTAWQLKWDGEYDAEYITTSMDEWDKDFDAGWIWEGNGSDTLVGLEHLEGGTVTVFSEGSVIEDVPVENATIKLPFKVKKAVAGLPYSSVVSSMEISLIANSRNSMSVINSLVGATVYFQDTSRVMLSATGGDDLTKWKDVGVSLQHDISSPYTLTSGKFYYTLSNEEKLSDSEVGRNRVHVRCDLPLPVTISAIGMRVNAGDL